MSNSSILTPETEKVADGVREIDQPSSLDWSQRVRPELAKEVANLQKLYDGRIVTALRDTATMQDFLRDPAKVLTDLEVPLSNALRKGLEHPTGFEKVLQPRRFRLPGGRVLAPQVRVRVGERARPAPQKMLYEWMPFDSLFKPSGVYTHGYASVLEISQDGFNEFLGQILDGQILNAILKKFKLPAIDALIGKAFSAVVRFDPPANLQSDETGMIGLSISIPTDNPILTLNWKAKIVRVDVPATASASELNLFQMELSSLESCHANLGPLDVSRGFKEILTAIGSMPVFALPVESAGRHEYVPRRVDMRIMNSASGTPVLGLLLDFPGGSPTALHEFTQPFVSSGAGMMVDFVWLRNKILPLIETALKMPDGMIDRKTGTWSGAFPIPDGGGANLTGFALGVMRGTDVITVYIAAEKHGFCYSATAAAGASVEINVDEKGILNVNPPELTLSPPVVDVPWGCYILSILVGGALADVVLGSIGSLIGGVVAPVLLHSTEEALNQSINSAMSKLSAALRDSPLPSLHVNLGTELLQYLGLDSFETIPVSAHIDDLMLLEQVRVRDAIPALLENSAYIHDGGSLSLLTGDVQPGVAGGADLVLGGTKGNRVLIGAGGTSLASLGAAVSKYVTRYQLYKANYSADLHITPQPDGNVYAARLGAGNYAYFTVTAISDDGVRVRFKTYPLEVPACQINGDFRSKYRKPQAKPSTGATSSVPGTTEPRPGKQGSWWSTLNPVEEYYVADGVFTLQETGFFEPVAVAWSVQGQVLTQNNGSLAIDGIPFEFTILQQQLTLTMNPGKDLDVSLTVHLEAVVSDVAGRRVQTWVDKTARAFHDWGGVGSAELRIPPLDDYFVAYKEHIGPWVEVDPEMVLNEALQKAGETRR